MTGLQFLRQLHEVCQFQTREGAKIGLASNGELKRWLQNGAVVVNGFKMTFDEEIDFPIRSLILFPKKPITLV
jgi:hypothetical protein